jgi:hypothetical protein
MLRDDTNAHTTDKPVGGWFVSPIHAVLMARDGKVLVTGTERIAPDSCNGQTQRNYGLTFVLDPAQLDAIADGAALNVEPIPEQARDNDVRHVLYCSGHTPLADGRMLHTGGTDYPRTLPISSPEYGLNYSRIFDPDSMSFTRVDASMKGGSTQNPGMKWYPTNRLLPDGRVLIMGGYHWSVGGTGDKENRSLEIFDPAVWDANPGADPYTVLTQHSDVSGTINAAGRAYTHVYLLPKPIPAANGGGLARTIVLIGSQGEMRLFNHEPGMNGSQRILRPTNARLPNPSAADPAEGSTSVMLPDGRVMIMNGGRDGPGSAVAHFYDPYNDSWDDLDLGIGRTFSTATWLPDGTVLLLNGYTSEIGSPWSLQNAPGGADGVRQPQIIDPFAKTVNNETPWPEPTARGYHSVALLLKDGRVLLAGGKDNVHDTGCEKNEARIYSPPYLAKGPRPAITSVTEGQQIVVGGAPLTIEFTGSVRAERGVVLMAPGAMTHSYNQNQRYLPLRTLSAPSNGSITVLPPATINEAPPGEYILHVISEEGAPSTGVYVKLAPPPACVYPVDLDAGVFIEAEGSSRSAGPFQRVDEMGRGNDAFIQVDPAATSAADVPDEGSVMWYDLDVSGAASAYLWMLGNGPSATSDTLFVSVNGSADRTVTLSSAAWGWTRAEEALDLPAGRHTLKIKAAKPGAQLDRIWLTSNAEAQAPDGLGAAAPDAPCSKGPPVDPGTGGSGGMAGSGGVSGGGGGPGGGGNPAGAGAGNPAGAGAGNPAGAGAGNPAGAGGGNPSGGGNPGGGGNPAGGDATVGGSNGGSAEGGGTTTMKPQSDDGCGCRVVSSSRSGFDMLGLFGILSLLSTAVLRRRHCGGAGHVRRAGAH